MRLAWVAAATVALSAAASAQQPGSARPTGAEQQGAPETVSVGSRPKFTFTGPMVNGLGVKTLADLQGRPVLVEFWGTQ